MAFFLWIPALPILALCIVGLVLASRKPGPYPRATINVASYVLLAAGIAFLAVAAGADRPAVS